MVINKTVLKQLESTYQGPFSEEFKRYLLVKYAQEPFPHEYSEQDLYANIERDMRDYDAGSLDISMKNTSEHWREEREYLQNLYIEKSREVHHLEEYVAELEQILSKHGLESSKMAKQRIERNQNNTY